MLAPHAVFTHIFTRTVKTHRLVLHVNKCTLSAGFFMRAFKMQLPQSSQSSAAVTRKPRHMWWGVQYKCTGEDYYSCFTKSQFLLKNQEVLCVCLGLCLNLCFCNFIIRMAGVGAKENGSESVYPWASQTPEEWEGMREKILHLIHGLSWRLHTHLRKKLRREECPER